MICGRCPGWRARGRVGSPWLQAREENVLCPVHQIVRYRGEIREGCPPVRASHAIAAPGPGHAMINAVRESEVQPCARRATAELFLLLLMPCGYDRAHLVD